MDYCKLNHVVTPIAAVVSDRVSLPEQINVSHGTWCVAIDKTNVFFFPQYLLVKPPEAICFQLVRLAVHLHGSASCHNLVCRELSLQQNITLVHYIVDIVLIGPSEQEVDLTGKTFACQRVRNKSDKISGAFHLSEISKGPVAWNM